MSPTSRVPATYRITFEDWLRFADDGNLHEILEGELCVSPPPSTSHQLIVSNLLFRLRLHLRTTAAKVFCAPTGVRLSEEDVLQPDVFVILGEHAARIEQSAVVGAPDLVVEVLSPGTAVRDLGSKRKIYERSGVPEYWIVDPVAATVQVLALRAGAYHEAGLYERDQVIVSPLLPAFEIPLSEVF